jgi:hypothetical protein
VRFATVQDVDGYASCFSGFPFPISETKNPKEVGLGTNYPWGLTADDFAQFYWRCRWDKMIVNTSINVASSVNAYNSIGGDSPNGRLENNASVFLNETSLNLEQSKYYPKDINALCSRAPAIDGEWGFSYRKVENGTAYNSESLSPNPYLGCSVIITCDFGFYGEAFIFNGLYWPRLTFQLFAGAWASIPEIAIGNAAEVDHSFNTKNTSGIKRYVKFLGKKFPVFGQENAFNKASYDYDAIVGFASASVGDIEIIAPKYWRYQNSLGLDVWDIKTGERLQDPLS